MFPNDTSPDSSPESIPPIYWLGVCRGLEAAKTFATCSWEGLSEVLVHYPILILPEFPDAIRALASLVEDANAQKAFAARAINLSLLHDLFRQEDPQLLASLYHSCGIELVQDYRQDRRLNVDRSIALFDEALHGLVGLDAANCRMNRAIALVALADLGEEPRANLRHADALFQEAQSGLVGPDAAHCRMNRANALAKLARLGEEPLANLRHADALLQEAQSGLVGPDAAHCQMNGAIALVDLADLGEEPRANLRHADALLQEAQSGLVGLDAALCRMNRAVALVDLADLGEEPLANLRLADMLFEHAVSDLEGPAAAHCRMSRAEALRALARLGEEPRANLRRADALLQRAQSGLEGPAAARCRMSRANLLTDLARQGEEPRANLRLADALYQEAVSDLQGPSAALCRMNRATTLQELALLGEEPRANLRRADALYQAAQSGLDKPNAARCRMNRANALRASAEMGDDVEMNYDQAASLHERAGQIFDALDYWIDASKAYMNLGWLEQTRDRWGPARDAYVRGIDASERVRSATLAVSDRRQWSESQHRLYQRAVEASLRIGDDAMACASAERGRSRALLDLLHTEDVVPRIERVKAERYRRLRRRLEELETLLAVKAAFRKKVSIDPELRERLTRERDEVRRELAELEEEIRASDPDFFVLAKPLTAPEISDLARRLGMTVVVLWVGAQSGRAFLLPPGGGMTVVELPGLNDTQLREWLMGPANGTTLGGWLAAYAGHASSQAGADRWRDQLAVTLRDLGKVVMGPIRSQLPPGESSLALLVSGLLNLLPLHAASREEHGETRSLVHDGIAVCYAPSAWVLRRCVEMSRPGWAPVLGVADPQSNLGYGDWELDVMERLFAALDPSNRITRLAGSAATVAAVTEALRGHPTSYLSCHGSFGFGDPLRSALHMADGDLTLAYLLGQMRLEVARLVILSACETGIGFDPNRQGEEYLGLPAGFIVAGAKSVIGSLWSVPDLATALLMVRLIENLRASQGIAEALREAQHWLSRRRRADVLEFVKSANFTEKAAKNFGEQFNKLQGEYPFSHPYYWAAFAVFGSPELLIPQEHDNGKTHARTKV